MEYWLQSDKIEPKTINSIFYLGVSMSYTYAAGCFKLKGPMGHDETRTLFLNFGTVAIVVESYSAFLLRTR